ncbi:MAG: DNA methyltransferase [bacterium]
MYYAFLGHQPELSTSELAALTGVSPVLVLPNLVSLPLSSNLLDVADKLGGTSKVASTIVTSLPSVLLSKLVELIVASPAKNISISNFSAFETPPEVIRSLKEQVTAVRPVRFVSFNSSGHELLMLKKKHVDEFNLIPNGDKITIAKTVWIYDSLAWAARDRRRPYQNIKKGMLPLKIARIMVNLATQGREGLMVLDPFCGTGTILAEAMLTGCNVVGSDIDKEAVKGSTANLTWLSQKTPLASSFKLFSADATHVDQGVNSADCIVTEPFLGPLLDSRHQLSRQKIKNVAKGIEKLYRGALKNWFKILSSKAGSRVVIILPEFHLDGHVIPTLSLDTIQALGYNCVLSVAYHKPGATVIRNITILEKK